MIGISDIPPLPENLRTSFEVIERDDAMAGQATWVLRDVRTGKKYVADSRTADGWESIASRPPADCTPSIILSINGNTMIAMALRTGIVYRNGAPPTGLSVGRAPRRRRAA